MSPSTKGLFCALVAYFLWGVLPVYWKALRSVPATQILGHRMVWSFVFLGGLILWRREWKPLRASVGNPRTIALYLLAAILLSLNWFIYIWAVNSGRIVETSLGYFINPLLSILLGLVVLRERLGRLQWVAVGFAVAGVASLSIQYGGLPWLALALAFTFGLYGLMKKQAPLGALHGLMLETGILLVPAVIYLVHEEMAGRGALGSGSIWTRLLLLAAGVITAFPLLLFAYAARAISLSTLGILQYLSPTCGLLIGVFVYDEAFPSSKLIGFGLIWAGLLVYWLDLVMRYRKR